MLPIPDHPRGTALFRLLTHDCEQQRRQGIELAASFGLADDPLVRLVQSVEVHPIAERLTHYTAALRPGGERAYTSQRDGPFVDALERLHWHLTGNPPRSRWWGNEYEEEELARARR